ncbi:MAG: DUF3137 domain-containing protein [Lachnospiraceae bacterium]|nr:DUF3137 domain-containing protein [Lachnospiraceae bacterium]
MGTMTDDEIISKVSKIQRKGKTINFIANASLLLFPVAIIGGLVMIGCQHILGPFILIAGIIGLPVAIITGKKTKTVNKEVKNAIGEYVIKDVIAERIEIIKYTPDNFMNQDFIKSCSILPKFDRISGSDYILGRYNGVKFTYCDLHMEREHTERRDGKTKTTYRTVFQGPLMTIELGQKMDGYVRIKERKTPRKEKGFFSDVFSGAADVLGVKTSDDTIEVESVEFNNQFEIKSNNQQMAFYILTPDFMESIVQADALAQGYTNLLFKGTNAVVTINNGKDSLEIKRTISGKNQLEKSRQRIRDDLSRVLAIYDKVLEKEQLF